ncbi:hypothetical protein Tsubulata_012940 [Turnera subulata]|uniref:DUF4283 domain-containing protein n=1 Tax=Turnera subulata TaxID=218843 RepID=A0A9Q0GG37_9ROSI|nr:hypothetical protein Tsubulata_012940 [Turnera subulata]
MAPESLSEEQGPDGYWSNSQEPVLNLDSDEEEELKSSKPVLVGKLISDVRRFSSKVVGEVMSKAWNVSNSLGVSEVKENTFLFTLDSVADMLRILSNSPWNISGTHICLREWSPNVILKSIKFDRLSFWVQVSGLPPHYYDKVGHLEKDCSKCLEDRRAGRQARHPANYGPHLRASKSYGRRGLLNLRHVLGGKLTGHGKGLNTSVGDFTAARAPPTVILAGLEEHTRGQMRQKWGAQMGPGGKALSSKSSGPSWQPKSTPITLSEPAQVLSASFADPVQDLSAPIITYLKASPAKRFSFKQQARSANSRPASSHPLEQEQNIISLVSPSLTPLASVSSESLAFVSSKSLPQHEQAVVAGQQPQMNI